MIRRRLPGLLALVWALSIVLSAFLYHQMRYNPLGAQVIEALGRLIVDVGAVAALLALSGALGWLLLRRFSGDFGRLERCALTALLGLGVIGFAVLGIGVAGLFPPTWLAWLAMASLLVVLHKPGLAWLRCVCQALGAVFLPEPDGFNRWLRNGLVVLLGLAFLSALAPPTAWDALTYHLEGPRLYLQSGRIISYPQNHFLGFPQGVQMLYLWLMILARPQAAALLHGCFGVLALLLALGLAERAGRPSAGLIAAAALLTSTSVWGEFSLPYNDLALMAYALAALAVIGIWDQSSERTRADLLALAGVLTGLALGTKYTAAGVAVGLGVLVLWLSRRDGLLRLVRAGGVVSVVALAVLAPWLIKNAVLDGNPLSPFVWGTSAFDRFDQWYYLRPGTGLGMPSLLFAPVQATVVGSDRVAPYGASSGVLVLALLPVAFVGWRRRADAERTMISHLLIFCLPPYLIWVAGLATSWYLTQTRLLFPIFPMLGLVGGLGLDGLRDADLQPDVGRLLRPVVLVVLGVALVSSSLQFVRANTLSVTFGMQTEESYLMQAMGVDYLAMQQVNTLPKEARVLFLWEPRTFYCERHCIPDSLINQWWHDRQLEPDPRKIPDGWREQGITHVLVSDWGMDFLLREEEKFGSLSQTDVDALGEVRQEDLALLWDFVSTGPDGKRQVIYSLYRIKGVQP